MKTMILTTAILALATIPLAGADSMGDICAPPSVRLCVEYGTYNENVYRPDVSAETWEFKCYLDMVCLRTPDAVVGREYLTSAPVPYVYVYCPPYNYCFNVDSELPALLA